MKPQIPATDPALVAKLQKEAAALRVIRQPRNLSFPRFVIVPGKRRPVPSGWQNRNGILAQ